MSTHTKQNCISHGFVEKLLNHCNFTFYGYVSVPEMAEDVNSTGCPRNCPKMECFDVIGNKILHPNIQDDKTWRRVCQGGQIVLHICSQNVEPKFMAETSLQTITVQQGGPQSTLLF